MASTLTRQSAGAGPGAGAKRPAYAQGDRTVSLAVYKLAFGNPYVVGGEDISTIFSDFATVDAVVVSQNEATVADRRAFIVDYTGKKLLMFTAFNTESGAVDQTAVADVRLLVFGKLK